MGGFRITKVVSNVSAIGEKLKPSIDVTAKIKDIACGNDLLNFHVGGFFDKIR